MPFVHACWEVLLELAPWMVLGLFLAGLLKAAIPEARLARWFGGTGFGPIWKAALLGTPLPLCSCSVLPVAIGLRRQGVSKGATVSFLVATPENGADSILLTYALLGPVMMVVRPVAAIFCAICAGGLAAWTDDGKASTTLPASCCSKGACASDPASSKSTLAAAFRFACVEVFDDLAAWVLVGIVSAGALNTWLPPRALETFGSGLPAMLGLLLVSVPAYVCATASTPIAAALLAAGVSPGTALVFLLAGPATNIGGIVVIRRELGSRAAWAYLAGVCLGALACGLLFDALAARWGWIVLPAVGEHAHALPFGVPEASVAVLGVLACGTLWRKWLARKLQTAKNQEPNERQGVREQGSEIREQPRRASARR
ncbi:MAG: SO_0444 family Cu/Zn efflux transporter [Planctomycetota bacterium]|nr:SO_0444 family Cu/Zn efflux transporter [Planctomycetota bacterium]